MWACVMQHVNAFGPSVVLLPSFEQILSIRVSVYRSIKYFAGRMKTQGSPMLLRPSSVTLFRISLHSKVYVDCTSYSIIAESLIVDIA